MTKADYIHLFKEACGGKCNAEYNPCAFRQAANSLAALKPVGMASKHIYRNAALFDGVMLPEETLLYALDEENNEDAPLS